MARPLCLFSASSINRQPFFLLLFLSLRRMGKKKVQAPLRHVTVEIYTDLTFNSCHLYACCVCVGVFIKQTKKYSDQRTSRTIETHDRDTISRPAPQQKYNYAGCIYITIRNSSTSSSIHVSFCKNTHTYIRQNTLWKKIRIRKKETERETEINRHT